MIRLENPVTNKSSAQSEISLFDVGADDLLPAVYERLQKVAARFMRAERPEHSLQATALVHEAYARLSEQSRTDWQGTSHFCAVAATTMRRILLDHARKHAAKKRGGGAKKVSIEPGRNEPATEVSDDVDLVELDVALQELSKRNERQAMIVELRYFGGLTIEETALALDVSTWTVKSDWRVARAWLLDRLRVD